MANSSFFVYVAQLAIPKALEHRFADLYDNEHVPALMGVPGVRSCSRLKLVWSDTQDMPEYLALYELDSADLPKTAQWGEASNRGLWPTEIRPHLTVRKHGMFERLGTVESAPPE